jgi:hypothetical protein
MRSRSSRLWFAAAAVLTVAGTGLVSTVVAQAAAAGCRVVYSVPSQWNNGFTGNVTVTNLGDALNGWRLTWTFAGNQQIAQSWNSTYTQSGAQVTVTNAGWNAALATGASASFGFNANYSGANPEPATFALNGVTCTGTPTTTGPASPSASASASPSRSPSSSPPSNVWNPPSRYVNPLAQVWQHQEQTYNNGNLYGFRNYGWDQLFAAAAGGKINYCVRWDSSARVTTAQRDQIHAQLQRQFQKWMNQMLDNGQGWNGWPYNQVPVKVVGWAVRDRAQLEWTDSSVDIYVNNIRENAPQCGEPCGRFFHQDGNYSGCPGGASHHYDMSLWLTSGFGGGAGGDWGQRIGSEYYMSNLNSENVHILLHEMGHTFGLDDFYDYDPLPGEGFIMKAGSASQITEFDKWMLRDFWRHLKNRYGY